MFQLALFIYNTVHFITEEHVCPLGVTGYLNWPCCIHLNISFLIVNI